MKLVFFSASFIPYIVRIAIAIAIVFFIFELQLNRLIRAIAFEWQMWRIARLSSRLFSGLFSRLFCPALDASVNPQPSTLNAQALNSQL